jgi:hypothetical protein
VDGGSEHVVTINNSSPLAHAFIITGRCPDGSVAYSAAGGNEEPEWVTNEIRLEGRKRRKAITRTVRQPLRPKASVRDETIEVVVDWACTEANGAGTTPAMILQVDVDQGAP